ncbi:uncharacterized protein JCM6883_007420 [Sporobolomyces salmoneus]|uniref:uncharacterized protein n=1 Tax=Sporobolomyces salmoneus TaxID=183962 RepID=UPI0031742AD1
MEPPLSILDSLHSSRQNLLHVAFPPFSSPSLPHLEHPPHRISQFATTNVTIGPHSFPDTRFYLVEWTTPTRQPPPVAAPPPPRATSPPKTSSAAQAITPSLIQRLNAASLTDPALATLLRRAATGQASPEELGGLSKKIEELRKEEELEKNPTPNPEPAREADTPVSVAPPTIPHPALVIEFAESAPNRFLVPDHFLCVVLTPRSAPSTMVTTVALLLSFFVFPPDRSVRGREHELLATEGGIPPPPPVPIDMIVEGVKEGERDLFMRASRLGRPRDAGLENWWKNTISTVPPRVHVVHQAKPTLPQLPEAPSLSRTNSEATGTVPMKRGASGTPMSAGGAGAANKRGRTSVTIEAPAVSVTRRASARGSNTRSRSGAPVDYRDSPDPSPGPEDYVDNRPPPSAATTRRSSQAGTGSPVPSQGGPPMRKKPGPKPGSMKGRTGGRGGKKRKKEASSDEDDWSGIKVIE